MQNFSALKQNNGKANWVARQVHMHRDCSDRQTDRWQPKIIGFTAQSNISKRSWQWNYDEALGVETKGIKQNAACSTHTHGMHGTKSCGCCVLCCWCCMAKFVAASSRWVTVSMKTLGDAGNSKLMLTLCQQIKSFWQHFQAQGKLQFWNAAQCLQQQIRHAAYSIVQHFYLLLALWLLLPLLLFIYDSCNKAKYCYFIHQNFEN